MAQYRVAVIGHTGQGDYGHGLDVVWKEIPAVEIVAVADPDPNGRKQAAERLSVSEAFDDYRRMLDKIRPNIVSVAPRWLSEHREMVEACAEHGDAHLYGEAVLSITAGRGRDGGGMRGTWNKTGDSVPDAIQPDLARSASTDR